MKILIADDELTAREILFDFFTMQGFNVIEAEDGQIAFSKFQEENPDIAILDLEMPGMKGDEVAKLIMAQNPEFPVVILSGFIDQSTAEDLLKAGIHTVIEKPVNLIQIKNIVNDILKEPS